VTLPWAWPLLTPAWCAAVSLLIAGFAAAQPAGELIERTLAIVGSRPITLMDVRGALALKLVDVPPGEDPIDAATERLIDRTLVIREVDRYAVPEPADAEVEARVARLMSAFPSQEAFRDTLASVAFTEAQLRAWARNDLRIEAYLDQRFASAETPERRADLVRDWIADLRRRTPVVDLRK
jgi:hypothetical protein